MQHSSHFRLSFSFLLLTGSAFILGAEPSFANAAQHTALAGQAEAISSNALKAATSDAETRRFYKRNGWHEVWSDQASQVLMRNLDDRVRHGLDHLSFLPEAAPATAADRDVGMTRAALRYASALVRGASSPEELHSIYTLPRPKDELSVQLADALATGHLASWFASLAPQDADYATLSKAYLQARREAADGDQTNISSGIIRVGDTDGRIALIVKRLVDGEYLPDPAPAAGATYTPAMSDAVKHLQRDYGINEDGVIGPDTFEVLNLSAGDRARALAVALDRRRWLSRDVPATRIDVNTAAARLEYYKDGKLIDSRRVIVGKPGKETPLLLAPIYRLVANPTWTIPKSIQRGEMAGVSNAYLRSHNMTRRNGWIVQSSGSGNALGVVKFDMQDRYAIYLHDTSARSLFERSERHLSHGCVRVEDALGFAELIAKDQGIVDPWAAARASGKQNFVKLKSRIPVRLLYRNVFVDRNGEVAFRTDPYGWNAPIAKVLGFGESSSAKSRAQQIDVGP